MVCSRARSALARFVTSVLSVELAPVLAVLIVLVVHDESSGATNDPIPGLPSPWTQIFELRAAVGYKDNLLLSNERHEGSIFTGTGVDVVIGRLPVDGRHFNFLLSADDRQYWQGRSVDHEDLVVALTQFKLDVGTRWQLGLDGRYLFQDEVIDASIFETNQQSVLVRSHTVALLPNVRWRMEQETWLEWSGTVLHSWFEEPLDDYAEIGPRITIGRDYGNRSSVQLSYSFNERAYADREQTSLNETNLPGTTLKLRQHEIGFNWRHNWDATRRWRTGLRLGVQINGDNGPGYYDYTRWLIAPQVRYVARVWEIKAEAKYAHYAFDQQPAVSGGDELRTRNTVAINLRGERTVYKEVKLFLDYEREQSFANRPADEYLANTVSGGVIWEF